MKQENDSGMNNNNQELEPNENEEANVEYSTADPIFSSADSDVYEWNFSDYEAIERENQSAQIKRSKGLTVLSLILFLALVAVVMMFAIYINYNNHAASDGTTQSPSGPGLILNDFPATGTSSSDNGDSTAQISANLMPSVVGIETYNFSQSYDVIGQGSGVIMSDEGYIITNAHVLLDSDNFLVNTIKVILQSEEAYEAELIGTDSKTDIAVIKIDAVNLTAAEFGNSDQISVGDRAIAIGNPGGVSFMGSVSQGIISGLNRTVKTDSGYSMSLIQTDAAINPGNSGGPLVNHYGQVIGINSAKIKQLDYEGIGFSIPINTVQPVVDDLIKYGYVQNRVALGITYNEVDSVLSKTGTMPAGLYVIAVEEGTSAWQNGLKEGDIITAIDGKSVTSTEDLNEILDNKVPGDEVRLKVYRASNSGNASTLQLSVTLEQDHGYNSGTQKSDSNGYYG